ncbi:GNAT family N-acetyltransferase [Brachybacterium sp. YJGR34]|uniref:GNAT family N-acetyltransferase n=1 Tax=Brachybacterium sp. YJGR34 TaxID=2059911 RepID=UPI000E0B6B95|nr:GNAT family N-acetyltransferase [Brachybacterium sp. YJGR34]
MHIEPATEATARGAADVLTEAFVDDPVYGYLLEGADRRRRLDRFFLGVVRTALGPGGVVDLALDEDRTVLGAAVWSRHPAPPAARLRNLREGWRMPLALRPRGVVHLRTYLRRTAPYRTPGPHWSLDDIGVSAAGRGRGVGGALIRHRLALIDEQRAIVDLDSTTRGSRRLYARYGFRVAGPAGTEAAPEATIMVRTPPEG